MSERIRLFELLPDTCLHTYGSAPCDAVLGTTGQSKCFNTRISCQSVNNYKINGFSASPETTLTGSVAITPPDGFTLDFWLQLGAPTGTDDVVGLVGSATVAVSATPSGFLLKHVAATTALPDPPSEWFRLRLQHDVDAGEIVAWYNSRRVGSIAVTAPADGLPVVSSNAAVVACQGFKIWEGAPVMRPEIIERFASPGLLNHWAFVEGTGASVADRVDSDPLTTGDAVTWEPGISRSVNTLRFSRQQEGLPRNVNIIPSVQTSDVSPSRINLGGTDASASALGFRATCNVTFTDHPHHDRGVDPYARERVSGAAQFSGIGYDPNTKGTFWTKFLARNPYYEGRPFIVRDGLVGDALGDMQVREYMVDQLAIGTNDAIQLKTVDVLRRVDIERARAPAQSNGQLLTAITNASASVTLTPVGIGDAEYPASGYYTIGEEAGEFTRTGDVVTFVDRGILGSVADDHQAGDTFQLALYYNDTPTPEANYDLLVNYGGVPSSYCDLQDWLQKSDNWLGVYNVTRFIGKPTPVLELIASLLQQSSCYQFYDEINREIGFDQIRPLLLGDTVYALTDDTNLLSDQTAITDRVDQRLATVVINYGIRAPMLDKKRTSYRTTLGFIDGAALSDAEYGSDKQLEIFADWLLGGDARDLGYRLLVRFRDVPKRIMFRLTRDDGDAIKPGAIVSATTRQRVDLLGDPSEAVLYQVIERRDEAGSIAFLAQDFPFSFQWGGVISPDTAPDFSSATSAERAEYAYITNEDGTNVDGSVGHVIL